MWNYVEDKLRFLECVWRYLRDDGRGYVEYLGSPIGPSLERIIEMFGLEELFKITESRQSTYILEMTKRPGRELKFGQYVLETTIAGTISGDVNSEYRFVNR